MTCDQVIYKIIVTGLLFIIGVWLFNHFAFPIIGIIVAFIYPLFLLYRYIKKANNEY